MLKFANILAELHFNYLDFFLNEIQMFTLDTAVLFQLSLVV